MESVIKVICDFYAVTIGELTTKGRRPRRTAWLRQMAVFLARERGVSTKVIARTLGCCPSYCTYSVQVTKERMEIYEMCRDDMKHLRHAIKEEEQRRAS